MGRVEIIEGFYRDTLTNPVNRNYGLKKAAVVNVDCDLYSSAKEVLAFVEDLLHPGSIIIFDDWHAFDGMGESNTKERLGERRAFEEWSLNHCFEEFYDFVNGKAFLMLRRP